MCTRACVKMKEKEAVGLREQGAGTWEGLEQERDDVILLSSNITVKLWKPLRCPAAEGWIKTWCACAHNGKFSALKNKIMPSVGKWIQQEIMLSEFSQTQEGRHCVFTLIFVSQILSRYINHKCLGEQRG